MEILLLFTLSCLFFFIRPNKGFAHGYVEQPRSRSLIELGAGLANGLESTKGFPGRGPIDGRIASGNCTTGSAVCRLDEQATTRWPRQPLNGGTQTFRWRITASHGSEGWQYWITRPGWNPNERLARYMFEQIAHIPEVPMGAFPPASVTHQVNVPTDRRGYHVILAIWDNGPVGQGAFYQVIDIELNNPGAPLVPDGSLIPEHPIIPGDFPTWQSGGTYLRGNRVSWLGYVFESRSNHFSQTAQPQNDTGRWQLIGRVAPAPLPIPGQPTNLHRTNNASNSVALSWNPSVNATEYHIQRGTDLDNMSIIAAATSNTFYDTTVTPNTNYYYRVIALNANGEGSTPSETLPVFVQGETISPPPPEPEIPVTPEYPNEEHSILKPPSHLRVTAATSSSLTLVWDESGQSEATGYTLYRNGIQVATVPKGASQFTDVGLSPNTSYTYTLVTNGVSNHSNYLTVSIPTIEVPEPEIPDVPEPEIPPTPPIPSPWQPDIYYTIGDEVTYDGGLYVASMDNINSHPNTWRYLRDI